MTLRFLYVFEAVALMLETSPSEEGNSREGSTQSKCASGGSSFVAVETTRKSTTWTVAPSDLAFDDPLQPRSYAFVGLSMTLLQIYVFFKEPQRHYPWKSNTWNYPRKKSVSYGT